MINAIQFQNKRVGSTFLQRAIDTHPEIKGIDEVFVNVARKPGMRKSGFVPYVKSDTSGPADYIRNVIWRTYPEHNTIFKLMFNQINHHGGLMEFIQAKKIPMIFLKRKNLVKQVISGKNAAWTHHEPIKISPRQLLQLVKHADEQNKYWSNILRQYIGLTFFYEDIIGERKDGVTYVAKDINTKLCGFFEVEDFAMFSDTKKKNKNDISVYLPNIEEIRKLFNGTKYKWMIGD